MSAGLRLHGNTSLFVMSDSRSSDLRLLGCQLLVTHRTGSNSQNTYRVREAGQVTKSRSVTFGYLSGQASSLLKADGAGSVTPKRSRQQALCDYFRVTGGVSNER